MNGKVKSPQHNHYFRCNQYLASNVDPEHATHQHRLIDPVVTNRGFELLGPRQPGWNLLAECAHYAGKNWVTTGNNNNHQTKSEDCRDCMVDSAMNGDKGGACDADHCQQCRSKPVHAVIEEGGRDRW